MTTLTLTPPTTLAAPCLFCRIVRRELPAAIVFEDDVALAFLDHRPVFKGHILLIPRQHLPTIAELDPPTLCHLSLTARTLSAALERGIPAEGTFLAINNRVSQSVPHLHIHLVPRHKGDGLRGFFWPRTKYADDEEMQDYRARIRSALV